jgi:acyl phosphate:glycerol-3-phosphate acyltransferase
MLLDTLAVSTPPAPVWIATLASYLLGAVPFGLLMARGLRGVDLRQVGSGNIGATNAMRVLGKGWGLVAFLLDVGKGFVPVLFLASWAAEAPDLGLARLLCAAAAVTGHCFPVYLGFKGGKGVATGCGAILAVEPGVFGVGVLVWAVTLVGSRYVGLASMTMGLSFPLAAWWLRPGDGPFILGCGLLTGLILVRHRANVGRMLKGEEPRIGAGKRAEESHDG